MWLLKLHIAISILCFITFYGFAIVCEEQIRKNGWLSEEKKKKKYKLLLVFLVPIMNFLVITILFLTILVRKEDFEALANYIKEESEDGE